MPDGAAAGLSEASLDGKTIIGKIEEREMLFDAGGIEQFGIDTVQPHGVAAADIGVALGVGMKEVDDATLADHRIVIEVLLETLPELH